LYTQEIDIKEETFGISSSSTSREDHEAHHKSRHEVNMTTNNPRHVDGRDAPGGRGARRDGDHEQRGRALAPASAKGKKEEGDDGDVTTSSRWDLVGSGSVRER
jgi:hypothetical protein